MPPGNAHTQKVVKGVEMNTAEACIDIAQRVARAHYLADDRNGWSAAAQVARFIEEELLGRTSNLRTQGTYVGGVGTLNPNRYNNRAE
jgi:hypothetical protein